MLSIAHMVLLSLTDIQKKVFDLIFNRRKILSAHYTRDTKELKINNLGNVFKILNDLEKNIILIREKIYRKASA